MTSGEGVNLREVGLESVDPNVLIDTYHTVRAADRVGIEVAKLTYPDCRWWIVRDSEVVKGEDLEKVRKQEKLELHSQIRSDG